MHMYNPTNTATFLHTPTHMNTCSYPLARNNLEGDIRNKFDTSANPRSALRTKRNLISDKPPDRISALAFCCWFTAIPSTLTSHTLAQFPRISTPLHCLFRILLFLPFPPASPQISQHLFSLLAPFHQPSVYSSTLLHSFNHPSCPHAFTASFTSTNQPSSLHLLLVVEHIVCLYISVPLSCRRALIPLVLNAGTTSSAYLNRQGSL